MTAIGNFPGGASLDLLYPHVVTRLGDDLIYSEEWRLLALKNNFRSSSRWPTLTISRSPWPTRSLPSLCTVSSAPSQIGGVCVLMERSPPYRRTACNGARSVRALEIAIVAARRGGAVSGARERPGRESACAPVRQRSSAGESLALAMHL